MKKFLLLVLYAYLSLSVALAHEPVLFNLEQQDDAITVKVTIADGWHVYARDPGHIGSPLRIYGDGKDISREVIIAEPEHKTEQILEDTYDVNYYSGNFAITIPQTLAIVDSLEIKAGACGVSCIQVDKKFELVRQTGALVKIILLGVLGGVILNLMPCVLPVVTLKILNLVKYSGRSRRDVQQSLLATIAGIVVSFVVLAMMTVFLKAGGENIGWGFHFQNPKFIYFLCLLAILYASNLWGDFEIPTLNALFTKLPSNNNGLYASFVTGVFATLMATPCTAPFLITAVTYALTHGSSEILAIYMSIALGFSVPYILLLISPQLFKLIPKPGAWMNKMQKTFAIVLILSAVWLLYVLYSQLGLESLLTIIGFIALIKFYISNKVFARPLILVILIALSFYLPFNLAKHRHYHDEVVSSMWLPFDKAKLEELLKQNKVVFIDITADWCITCKFNKVRVLNYEDFLIDLEGRGVVLMRGDVTSPNKAIESFLKEYNHQGVPFNLIFIPGKKEPVILSTILDRQEILKTIEKQM